VPNIRERKGIGIVKKRKRTKYFEEENKPVDDNKPASLGKKEKRSERRRKLLHKFGDGKEVSGRD